ncbi:ASCH domain-containing protein [Apilactobacillus timberlakei]|uniref:ASCH domain-containing protein n=1 Tax=Apilactobacillus timberlakei TaxID=2008380 RepID=UPI001127F6B1|nr:ASCH domain-containing protein [Apilactobacillus timberlakei]TPR19334.1 ASCH domain-containing protein [Apilactobacillus timberlakei]
MIMGLNEDQFDLIKYGSKTIEIRLNDIKRRNLVSGDYIHFISTKEHRKMIVQVNSIETFDTFKDIYLKYSGTEVGSKNEDSLYKMLDETYSIYSREQEQKWGVIAIHLTPLNN